jgi:hypothetical protein
MIDGVIAPSLWFAATAISGESYANRPIVRIVTNGDDGVHIGCTALIFSSMGRVLLSGWPKGSYVDEAALTRWRSAVRGDRFFE